MTASLVDSVPGPVREVARRLRDAGYSTWVVGGSVRDLLLGREVHDWDLASSARPAEVKPVFRKVIPTGEKHGTVTVLHGGMQLEVTTLRGEGAYSDGRHPDEVTFVDEIGEDLARRDLTVNAMALDLVSGELIDRFGGREDLDACVVRAVGDAVERFAEDGLRVMRAVRFATTLEFELDPATAAAIPGALPTFRKVSAERVRDELCKLLEGRQAARGLALLRETSLLAEVLPEIAATVGVEVAGADLFQHACCAVEGCDRGGTTLRFAALFQSLGEAPGGSFQEAAAAARRRLDAIRMAKKVGEEVSRLVASGALDVHADRTAGDVRRLMRAVGPAILDDAFALRRAWISCAPSAEIDLPALEDLSSRVAHETARGVPLGLGALAVDGRSVMKHLGRRPGRWVGELLEALLERVLEDPDSNEPERLLDIAEELTGDHD